LGRRSELLSENGFLLEVVGLTGFMLGAMARSNETQENFKRHNQLVIYTDKKAANVNWIFFII
jgi:hypothetical protein